VRTLVRNITTVLQHHQRTEANQYGLKPVLRQMNRPPFIPFDEHRELRVYRRSLPHWRQDGATYFVTFRLGDSIPVNVTQAWNDERRRWIAARLPSIAANPRKVGVTVHGEALFRAEWMDKWFKA
jgi:hypothetical protein